MRVSESNFFYRVKMRHERVRISPRQAPGIPPAFQTDRTRGEDYSGRERRVGFDGPPGCVRASQGRLSADSGARAFQPPVAREESDQDESFVRSAAGARGLECYVE